MGGPGHFQHFRLEGRLESATDRALFKGFTDHWGERGGHSRQVDAVGGDGQICEVFATSWES